MKTLFIDSSRKSLSIAVTSQDELLLVSNVNSYSKHSNYLMNEIDNILSKCNIKINDIDNYVVLNGPGSFTGVRVGLTIAKTLAWALNKKLYVENNLKALIPDINNEVIISIIYDKEKESYVGIYQDNKEIEKYVDINSELFNFNSRNLTLVSMEENKFLDNLYNKLSLNNTVDKKIIEDYSYIKLIDNILKKENINVHSAKPIYLKKIDAEK